MAEKHNIYYGQFIQEQSGKFVPATEADRVKYTKFRTTLETNQLVDVFMESNVDNGTVPQLAKIHVCIRELAKDLGYTFEDMKLEIKRHAGLCVRKELGGDVFLVCKSFAVCSKDELGLAIESIIEIGDMNGINFR